MPVKVLIDDVKNGLKLVRKSEIFSGYNGNDEDYITIDPRSNVCDDVVTVEYDTNFVISASDASSLSELIALTKKIIPNTSVNPMLNTIINGLDATNASINDAIDSEDASGFQEFRLVAIPCVVESQKQEETGEAKPVKAGPKGELGPASAPQGSCFNVSLIVIGTALITDADQTDPDEQVVLSLTLSVRDENPRVKTLRHPKDTNDPIPFVERISVGPIRASSPFRIYAKLDEYCETDGPGKIGRDSVSLIKVDNVKIVIRSVPCPAK